MKLSDETKLAEFMQWVREKRAYLADAVESVIADCKDAGKLDMDQSDILELAEHRTFPEKFDQSVAVANQILKGDLIYDKTKK